MACRTRPEDAPGSKLVLNLVFTVLQGALKRWHVASSDGMDKQLGRFPVTQTQGATLTTIAVAPLATEKRKGFGYGPAMTCMLPQSKAVTLTYSC